MPRELWSISPTRLRAYATCPLQYRLRYVEQLPTVYSPSSLVGQAVHTSLEGYFLEKRPGLVTDNARLPDLCASAQAAIVEVLVKKTLRAAKRERLQYITLSGGVARNTALRAALQAVCDENEIALRCASTKICTDNAAMIAAAARK